MSEKIVSEVLSEMFRCNRQDQKRIEHSLKVWGYARALGILEGLDAGPQFVLELTAILHDIGIHVAESKYGWCDGALQETEGPPVAKEILRNKGVDQQVAERVCFIISKHHTFSAIDGIDFQLLVEADFLVNAVEEGVTTEMATHFMQKNFRTESGKAMLNQLFPLF
ncbi:MAG: HD domain-containing protein [Marinilabiliales bacterium]|nr:HD domain-containing protein [Marinilabiliales bacterium]